MFDNRDNIDFKNTNIGTLFSRLFLPTLLGMIFSMTFILADGVFVGHGIGPRGLAAINLIGPIMMLINGLGLMIGVGISVVAAIHMSKGNTKAARIVMTQAFATGVIISLLMGLLCYAFPRQVLTLIGVSSSLYAEAYEYYIWFIPTCLLMMIESIGLFVIRLDGSPRYAMYANIIPAVVNIALDYIFIFPCDMGLMGASLATDIGGVVALVMVAYYMFFKAKTLRFYRLKLTRTSLRLSLRNIGYVMRTGVPGLVGELTVSVSMLTGNLTFNHYLGTDGVSAYSVACYLFPLVYMIYNAVAQSAQPIISYNHGADDRARVRATTRLSIIVSVVIGLAITLIFYFFAPTVARIFIDSGERAGLIAAEGLPLYATGFVFMAVNICVIGYYQSVEQSGRAVLLTTLRGIIFLVAAFVVMPRFLDTAGLWLAIPAAECATTAVIIATALAGRKGVEAVNNN